MKPRTRTLVPALLACALFALSPAADAQKAPKPPAPAAKPVPVAAKAEVAAAPAKQAAPKLELEKYVLDNGLEVILPGVASAWTWSALTSTRWVAASRPLPQPARARASSWSCH